MSLRGVVPQLVFAPTSPRPPSQHPPCLLCADHAGVPFQLGPHLHLRPEVQLDELGRGLLKASRGLSEYGIVGFPTVFIDRDGKIVRKWTGILNAEKIEELIQEMLESAP